MEDRTTITLFKNLNNGISMPRLGFGTYAIENIREIVYEAIKFGVRHFDTARRYKNEKDIGIAIKQAIEEGLIKREDLFITSKLSPHERTNPEEAIKRQLIDIGLDYFDLYLDHTPFSILEIEGKVVKTPIHILWKNMEDLVKKGFTKSIGVSNYNVQNLMNILSFCEIKPVVNQIEINPYLTQKKLVEYCQVNDVAVEAFNSLCKGKYVEQNNLQHNLLGEELIQKLSEKYKKTPGQIVLNWALSKEILIIPSTSSKNRIRENIDSLSFRITQDDIENLNNLDRNLRFDQTSSYAYTNGVEIFA